MKCTIFCRKFFEGAGMKKSIIVVIIVVVAAALVFFSLFWPLDKAEDMKGTIGGVEKAKKFRGEQIESADVLVENAEFSTMIQSAEWQNAMKNEELVSFLKSEDFTNFVAAIGDMQKIAFMNVCFNTMKNSLMEEPELNEDVVNTLWANENFQKAVFMPWNQDFQQLGFPILAKDFQQIFLTNIDNLEALDFIEVMKAVFANNSEMNNLFSMDLQNWVVSQDFEKLVLSQDYQNIIIPLSQDFQNLVWATPQDFQNTISQLSQDFQKAYMSQDFQKILPTSQDFQNTLNWGQDFQKVYMSQDFQSLLQNDSFGALFSPSQIYNGLVLGAFQDYMSAIVPPI